MDVEITATYLERWDGCGDNCYLSGEMGWMWR